MLSAPTPGCATLAGGTSMALPHSIPAARTNGIATHSAWMKPVPSSSRRRWAGSNTGALFLTPKRPKRLLKRSSTTFADLGLRSLKRISRYFAKKEEALCLLFLLLPPPYWALPVKVMTDGAGAPFWLVGVTVSVWLPTTVGAYFTSKKILGEVPPKTSSVVHVVTAVGEMVA